MTSGRRRVGFPAPLAAVRLKFVAFDAYPALQHRQTRRARPGLLFRIGAAHPHRDQVQGAQVLVEGGQIQRLTAHRRQIQDHRRPLEEAQPPREVARQTLGDGAEIDAVQMEHRQGEHGALEFGSDGFIPTALS